MGEVYPRQSARTSVAGALRVITNDNCMQGARDHRSSLLRHHVRYKRGVDELDERR